ncbi:MAG TPA: hypothetical protein VGG25_20760 [Streptosporangiaceae bacterium]|jgi:ABC-type nitrate/sulfonate/bicarbonate transport system substrate-binding protein
MQRRAATAWLLALASAGLTAGCSAGHPVRPPGPPKVSAAQALAAAAGRGPVIRLGITPTAADAAGLTGLQLGYFRTQLGPGITLTPVPFTTPAAEAAALAAGRLDAAYLPPVQAVRAWTTSRQKITVIAGAATRRRHGHPATAAVLAVTRRLLTRHPAMVTALLKAHIQATSLLSTNKTAGNAAAAQEFTALATRPVSHRALTRELAKITAASDPLPASIRKQASAAAAAGQVPPPPGLAGMYDLTPLNTLLRAAGLPAVHG